jgi:curved DNA-binding protein CbpA
MTTSSGRHNYYEILELSTSAAQHEVTTAYERARVTYTGENPAIYTIFSEQEARELLTMIEEAYAVLGNKTLRTIYDQRLFGANLSANDLTYQSILTASKTLFPDPKKEEKKPTYTKDEKFEEEIKTRTEWNGEALKKVREYKAVDVARMADKTKINSYYITAIESMDPKNLPALVFVRGYVIQMAKLLGLDDKVVADSYMKAYKAKNG